VESGGILKIANRSGLPKKTGSGRQCVPEQAVTNAPAFS
jgi:hypothetical protein